MQHYQYQPLLHDDEIRVLVLWPSKDLSDKAEIQCTLEHVRLSELPKYEAVSYAWGDGSKLRRVICNRKSISITESLFALLLDVRDISRPRRIWADAICINQDSTKGNAEKNAQVQMMGRIYSAAEQTIVWLGDDHD
ncbi:HET-domain-containing protein, partial [Colletotrichum eremochloae]